MLLIGVIFDGMTYVEDYEDKSAAYYSVEVHSADNSLQATVYHSLRSTVYWSTTSNMLMHVGCYQSIFIVLNALMLH